MATKKLLQTYRELLATADLEITDDDCVSLRVPQADGKIKLVPLTIKGQRLVLPTTEHLKNPDWENRVCFHTLSENTGAGESVVLEKLRACLNHRFNTVVPIVMMGLLRIGASLDDQKKLDPEQAEFLPAVKNVDAAGKDGKSTTIENFRTILGKMPAATPTKQFVNIGLRRGAKLDGVDHFRAGIVHFPFYAELLKREGSVHGVKLRKKDYDVFISLLDYILPHQGETNYYSRGSDSRTAPSTDAVMKAVLAVAGPLNDVITRFGKLLPDDLEIPCEWAPTFDNIGTLINEIREIPMLQGNEGTFEDDKPASVAAIAPAVAVHQAQAQESRAPVPGRAVAPQDFRAPVPGTQGNRPSHDSKTTDLEALLRGNPALAQQAGLAGQRWGGYQQPQQTRATAGNPQTPMGGQQQRGGWGNQGNQGGGGWSNQGGGGWRPSI